MEPHACAFHHDSGERFEAEFGARRGDRYDDRHVQHDLILLCDRARPVCVLGGLEP